MRGARLERRRALADLFADACLVAGITLLDEAVDASVLDECRRLDEAECKRIHTDNESFEHILDRIAWTTILRVEIESAAQAAGFEDLVHCHCCIVDVRRELVRIPPEEQIALVRIN